MKYIIATNQNQPVNRFGGKDPRKLGTVEAASIAAAKKEMKAKYGGAAFIMLPSEWLFAKGVSMAPIVGADDIK